MFGINILIFYFQHITFVQTFALCDSIISVNQGHLFLKAIIRELKESMGPSFVKSKWQESGLQLKQWMDENMVCYMDMSTLWLNL